MRRGLTWENIIKAAIALIVILVVVGIFYTFMGRTAKDIEKGSEQRGIELLQGGERLRGDSCGYGGTCDISDDCKTTLSTLGLPKERRCQSGFVCCKEKK